MDERFEFTQLFPDLQWEVVMNMSDIDLVNLCRSSKAMENFCNTKDFFWKERISSQFRQKPSDITIRQMLKNNGNNWFRVYFTLLRLDKLRKKLSPHLNKYNIIDLYNLKELSLSKKNLKEVPSEIGELVNLKNLNLSFNQIEELPSEIGNLTNLEYLGLSSNMLTELPKEIGNLNNLVYLFAVNNKLSDIPVEIGNASNLKDIYIQNNPFKDPERIKQILPNVNVYL